MCRLARLSQEERADALVVAARKKCLHPAIVIEEAMSDILNLQNEINGFSA